jgi:hypothetical protein
MNKTTYFTLFSIIGLLISPPACQGTTYLSNLSLSSSGSAEIASDSSYAQSFCTGYNSSGYVLNSITLLLNTTSGTPSGLTVSIYDYNRVYLGSYLGTLTASSTSDEGAVTFTGNITLSGYHFYYIVITANTPSEAGYYSIITVNSSSYSSTDGWSESYDWTSTNGSKFGITSKYVQYAIDATAVPEPSTVALLAVGLGILGLARRGKTR